MEQNGKIEEMTRINMFIISLCKLETVSLIYSFYYKVFNLHPLVIYPRSKLLVAVGKAYNEK